MRERRGKESGRNASEESCEALSIFKERSTVSSDVDNLQTVSHAMA